MGLFSTIASFISGIFEPAAKLIDNVHTSEEEKAQLRNKFAEIQASVNGKLIDYQTKVTELEHGLRLAELKSNHWLPANWRPLTAISIVVSIMALSFLDKEIPAALSSLANIFLPMYAGSRSWEKISKIKK